MSRRINFLSACAISALFLFFLYVHYSFIAPTNTSDYYGNSRHKDVHHQPLTRAYKSYNFRRGGSEDGSEGTTNVLGQGSAVAQNWTAGIGDVLAKQRARIVDAMTYFEYPGGRFGVDAEKLSDLTPETKGKPYQSIVITTWRSGSTFLGDILNAMPANFYHYESLLDFGIVQVRGPPESDLAIKNLKNLLKCDYTDMKRYLEFGQEHVFLFSHNTRLWNQCKQYPHLCYDPRFLNPFCKLFPLQSMKLCRLRLALTTELLDDESLNVRILLLVRDPRGTLQSRKHRGWCPHNPDCARPQLLCQDLVADYYAAINFTERYPQRFKVMRYEDLSINPYDMTQEILEFYGLPFDPEVEEFLDTHTKTDVGDVSSTFRDSKSAPFHWIKDLDPAEIFSIQEDCDKAMQLWGYRVATMKEELNELFNPLLASPFS